MGRSGLSALVHMTPVRWVNAGAGDVMVNVNVRRVVECVERVCALLPGLGRCWKLGETNEWRAMRGDAM
jgi:hypothetical protein